MELDRLYCDVVARFEQFTGGKAERGATEVATGEVA